MAEVTSHTNSNDSLKIAIAIALIRLKNISQSEPTMHWKQKAKNRKQEILRLTEELKHLQDDLSGDLYPQSAACKCFFFNNLQNLKGSDHRLNDVLRRRFLRLVRLHKRMKRKANNSRNEQFCSGTKIHREEEIEKLKISAEYLVDLCEAPRLVKKPDFANLVHQAVEFILGSLGHVLSAEKDTAVVEGTISSLLMRLVKRMCTPLEDEICDPETDAQINIQHVIRMLASASYVGQRVLLTVCHKISELAEQLLFLDPFDESFSVMHDSMFLMIQLIEFLMSDYLVTWAKDEGFDIRLYEEWLTSFLNARKTLQSMEKRSGLYAIYMDRVTGELTRQVCQVSSLKKLDQDILDELFS